MASAALLAAMGCQHSPQTPASEPQAQAVAEATPSIIDLNTLESKTIENFKGGQGTIEMRSYQQGETKVMYCVLPAGSSVGYHTHDHNMEMIYVLSGTADIFYDSVDHLVISAGQGRVHYCSHGHGHSITNAGQDDLCLYNVVAAE